MFDVNMLDRFKRLAFQIAPELAASPLYILSGFQVERLPFKRDWLGLAIPGSSVGACDYNIKAAIGDDWNGNGNVVILDYDKIAEAASCEGAIGGCLLNVLLHELAHLLPMKYIPPKDHADIFDCQLVRDHQRQKLAIVESLTPPAPGTPESGHDSAFFRRLVHLWTRATAAGWEIPAGQIFGNDLGFPPAMEKWVVSLLPELFRFQSASFTQIEATPPPAAFHELWQSTLQSHQQLFCEVTP